MPKDHVLFVDDEASLLKALRRSYKSSNYQLHLAENIETALKIMEANPIDVVISDMRMQEMDGAKFLRIVSEKWPQTYRILLTSYADNDAIVKAVHDGRASQYLNMPWNDDAIKTSIDDALKLKHLREEHASLSMALEEKDKALDTLNAEIEDRVKKRTKSLSKALDDLQNDVDSMTTVFAQLIEFSSSKHTGHAVRVAHNAAALAEKCDFTQEDIRNIKLAALLADVGRIGISPAVRFKPQYSITKKDKVLYERFPTIAHMLLRPLQMLKEVNTIVVQLKESYDGSGFPKTLKGKAISKNARLLKIVKEYDEIQIGLITPTKHSPKGAKQFIEKGAEKHYDPELVAKFSHHYNDIWGKSETGVSSKDLTAQALKPGMITAKEVLTDNGLKILSSGIELTEALIEKLIALGVPNAHIRHDSIEKE